jgi:hypothetical protein
VTQYPHNIASLAHHAASPATEEALVKLTARARHRGTHRDHRDSFEAS